MVCSMHVSVEKSKNFYPYGRTCLDDIWTLSVDTLEVLNNVCWALNISFPSGFCVVSYHFLLFKLCILEREREIKIESWHSICKTYRYVCYTNHTLIITKYSLLLCGFNYHLSQYCLHLDSGMFKIQFRVSLSSLDVKFPYDILILMSLNIGWFTSLLIL